jgi:cell division protein FtsN
MADRYQDRPFPSDADYDRAANQAARGESDPLAELARLIGQTDPLGGAPKTPHPLQSRANVRPQQYDPPEDDVGAPAGPPPWLQRARHEAPPEPEYEEPEADYQPSPVHPLHRYAAQPAAETEQDYHEPQHYAEEQSADPARYDDALYGQLESGQQEYARDPAYPDDPYAYQSGYEEEPEPRRRSSGLMTVAAVLALAVVGTGAAFAYRTYVGAPRSGEPPIIKADNSPTKVVPAPGDGASAKTPDRMLPGDGGEKIVSREETPVDVNARSGPRVVFPPLNQNGSPPPVASVTPAGPPPATSANGTMPNNEPRKIKTLAVKGDAENGGVPAGVAVPAKPAPAARTAAPAPAAAGRNPSSANASANTPLSLSPQGGPAPDPTSTRFAATNPVQTVPSGGSGYLVQVSSQKNEADAQASYRALQGKYPSVLGSQSSVVKRVDLGEKGVYYRAFAGPFNSVDQATQVCSNLKAAGGPQCLIQRN